MKVPTIKALANEIFQLVQVDQGFGFVSDGMDALKSRKTLFNTVRGALKHTEAAARKMRRWLRKYGELRNSQEKREAE